MPTVEEVTARLLPALVPVPPIAVGICDVCHGWTETLNGESFARCTSCARTVGQVTHPASPIIPITLCRGGDQIHDMLRGYKDSPSEAARNTHRLRFAALIARFLRDHGECIRRATGADWDTVTIVPSSRSREGTHPLATAVQMARAQHGMYRPLLERVDGVQLDHRTASDGAYRTIEDVTGLRVLLLDDTFTAGARVHSASSALTLGGADVVASVVAGRYINPDYHPPESDGYWATQKALPFDFDRCCVEDGAE